MSGPKMPPEALWKLFVLGLISSGVPLNIVESDEMKTFLEHTVGHVPTALSLYDSVAFKVEQIILGDVR